MARAALISDVVGVNTWETMLEKPHFPAQPQPELPRTLQRPCDYVQGAGGLLKHPMEQGEHGQARTCSTKFYLCQECWMTCGTPGCKRWGTGGLTQALLPACDCSFIQPACYD